MSTTQISDNTPVFHVPGKPGIVDVAVPDADGVLRGMYGGETLEALRLRYPGAVVGQLAAVSAASDAMFVSAPVEIDEGRWYEMLEVLPPEGWTRHGVSESFKLCERTSGSITAIFCRVGDRYFEMQDRCFLDHTAIVGLVARQFPDTMVPA